MFDGLEDGGEFEPGLEEEEKTPGAEDPEMDDEGYYEPLNGEDMSYGLGGALMDGGDTTSKLGPMVALVGAILALGALVAYKRMNPTDKKLKHYYE